MLQTIDEGHNQRAMSDFLISRPGACESQTWVDRLDSNGNTILMCYFFYSTEPSSDIVKRLIKSGVSIEHRNEYGLDALLKAASNPSTKPATFDILFEAGAKADI
jgi:ankyrin repeat protein